MSYLIVPDKNVVIFPGKVAAPIQIEAANLGMQWGMHNGQQIAVAPYTVKVAQAAQRCGVPLPSPIGLRYTFPKIDGLHDARPDQINRAGFLTLNPHAYDLSQIGTGKTYCALAAADFLMKEKVIRKVLVLATLSSLERAWSDAIFTTFTKRTCNVLYGTAERRQRLFAQDKDFYIINHDAMNTITQRTYDTRKRLLKVQLIRPDIDLVIIDELGEFRAHDTVKFKMARKLVEAIPYVWGLTGSPRPHRADEVWSQCRIVTPDAVSPYYTTFRQLTMQQITQFRWEDRKEANAVVFKAMQPSIRYTRAETGYSNEPVYSSREIELTDDQKKHYKQMFDTFVTMADSGAVVTAMNEGVQQAKLLQIVCGMMYDRQGNTVWIDAAPRVNEVKSIIEQAGEKVIVFVPFRSALEMVFKAITKDFPAAIIHGDIPKGQRDTIFASFQKNKEPHVIVADARCMSHSLTLTEASTIVWYAPEASNNTYTQANGRITRTGQVCVPNVIHLGSTALERKLYKRLQTRQATQGVLLDMVKEARSKGIDTALGL